jgi:hypothetical protein
MEIRARFNIAASMRDSSIKAENAATEAKALEIACERLALTKERVLSELMHIAFSNIAASRTGWTARAPHRRGE